MLSYYGESYVTDPRRKEEMGRGMPEQAYTKASGVQRQVHHYIVLGYEEIIKGVCAEYVGVLVPYRVSRALRKRGYTGYPRIEVQSVWYMWQNTAIVIK